MDWAPEALAGFRTWLQREYPSLDALNASWNTSFTNWEGVLPMTTEEAQKHGNFAPWSDHRVYMEQEFLKTFRKESSFYTRSILKDWHPFHELRCQPLTTAATGSKSIRWWTIFSHTPAATRMQCIFYSAQGCC